MQVIVFEKLKFQKQKGSAIAVSLLYVLIGLVILGTLTSTITQSQKNKKKSKNAREYNEFIKNIKNQMQDPQFCTTRLFNKPLASTSINSITRGISFRLGYGDNLIGAKATDLKSGWLSPNKNFKIQDVSLVVGDYTGLTSSGLTGAFNRRYYNKVKAKLVIETSLCNSEKCNQANTAFFSNIPINPTTQKRAFHGTSKYQEIELLLYLDRTNRRIKTCFGAESVGSHCDKMGGSWNPNEPDPKHRCNPYQTCYIKSEAGKSIYTTQPGAAPKCPNKYNPNPIGISDGRTRYLCEWCNINKYLK